MAIPTPTTLNYDPDIPVYAQPEDTEYQGVGITPQKSAGEYVDPATATVEGRVGGILATGNALTRIEEQNALRAANARGLLNTRGAVQAGRTAAIGKAIEIARPDAQLYGDMAKMSQKADQDAAINRQVGEIEHNRYLLNARLSAALTTQEQKGQVEYQKLTDNAQMQRIEVDNQWKQMINYENLDSGEQQALLGVSQVFGDSLTGGIERLLRDTNISNKTDAISALMTQYQTQMSTAGAIVNIPLVWS